MIWFKPTGTDIPDSVEYRFAASDYDESTGDWTSSDGSLTLSALGSPTKQAGALNGEDVVYYDGSDDGHETTSISISQPDAIVAVYRYETTGQSQVRGVGATISGDPYQFIAQDGPNDSFDIYAGNSYIGGSTSSNTNWVLHSGYFDGTNSETRINGQTDGTGDPGSNGLEALRVSYGSSGDEYTESSVAEFWVLKNPTLSDVEQAESILDDKYGIYGVSSDVFSDITSVSYNTAYDVSSETTQGTNILFKPDGAKMWISDYANARVLEYALTTAWDVTTANLSTTLDVSSQGTETQGVGFNGDGTKLYVPDLNSFIYEFDLSTAYDVSSATLNQSYEVTQNSESHPIDVQWSDDGTTCIIGAGQNDSVYEYSATTAYDISALSFVQSYNVQNEIPNQKLKAVKIADGGTQMFIVSAGSDNSVYRYTLGSAYSLSSVTYQDKLDASGQTSDAKGVDLKSDGAKLFVFDDTNQRVLEYA